MEIAVQPWHYGATAPLGTSFKYGLAGSSSWSIVGHWRARPVIRRTPDVSLPLWTGATSCGWFDGPSCGGGREIVLTGRSWGTLEPSDRVTDGSWPPSRCQFTLDDCSGDWTSLMIDDWRGQRNYTSAQRGILFGGRFQEGLSFSLHRVSRPS